MESDAEHDRHIHTCTYIRHLGTPPHGGATYPNLPPRLHSTATVERAGECKSLSVSSRSIEGQVGTGTDNVGAEKQFGPRQATAQGRVVVGRIDVDFDTVYVLTTACSDR